MAEPLSAYLTVQSKGQQHEEEENRPELADW